MTRVVQARCPSCKNVLRIPAEWLTQPMKCKHCLQIFQARSVTGDSAAPMPDTAAGADHDRAANSSPSAAPRAGGLRKAVLLLGLVLTAGGILMFARPQLDKANSDNTSPATGDQSASAPLVSVTDKKAEPTSSGEASPPAKIDGLPTESDPPSKTDVAKKTEADLPKQKAPAKAVEEVFPRRALLISVSNYLLFNPLHYGNPRDLPPGKYPGSSTGVLVDTMNRRPLNIPGTQITELSDAGKNAFAIPGVSTTKAVIENTIGEFVDTARAQDRIIVLFTGHGMEIGKEAYLVPVEGNRDDPQTLIPLSWIYDRLAVCKARQKLLILDVFRYPPARGEELPGTDAMTDDFDAKLRNPPAGVQVWASCIKGQQSIELEGGSVFLQVLCKVLQDGIAGIASPADALPLDRLVPKVNGRLVEILAPQKLAQQTRLSGTHIEEGGAAYNAAEPLPPRLVLKAVAPAGKKVAGLAMVKNIVDEINRLPPVRASQKQVQAASLPAFSAGALEEYNADYKSWPELLAMAQDKDRYPLRAAVLQAIKVLRDSEKIKMKETFGGPITPQVKKQFAATQQEPGIMIFQMETALAELKTAGQKRAQETSRRWLANYDYALARLQSRLVYLYEYNNILAQVRGDSLPPLEPIHTGWRVGSQKKVQISEPKVKEMVKNISKTWKRIAEENPGTPWAVLATRENMTALGLVWRPSRD
jgi:hypothetical protein